MTKRSMIAAAALLCSGFAVADVTEEEHFEFQLDDGGRISVENINGDIDVTAGSGNTVSITAYKRAGNQDYMDGLEVIIDADDDWIRIETDHPDTDGWGWFKDESGSVSYELTVPSSANLAAIDTVNGNITITGVSGDVVADTVNGDIEATGLASNFSGDTVNGAVEAEFDVVGGSQRIVGDTVNGRVVFRFPEDASARVSVDTVNGSIDCDDFGLEPDGGFIGDELKGDIGGGDARVIADTVNGSIKIRMR